MVVDVLPVDTLWSLSPAPSCPFPQMEPGEVTTVPDNELEVPASSGPSGDFEIREEEETTRPDLRNEVMAVVTPPAGPGPGRNMETGLMDNTIDSGNSAAQLPQKNILERKEVLIGEMWGLWGRVWGHRGLGCPSRGDSPWLWDHPQPPPTLLQRVSQGLHVFARKARHNFLLLRWILRGKKKRILVQRCSVVIAQHPASAAPRLPKPKSRLESQMIPPNQGNAEPGITHTHLPKLLRGSAGGSQGSPCLFQECRAQFVCAEMDFQERKWDFFSWKSKAVLQ